MMVCELFVLLALSPSTFIPIAVVTMALLVWLLLRGSRLIWLFLLLEAIGRIVGAVFGWPIWLAGVAVVTLVFLLAPASRQFVWREGKAKWRGWSRKASPSGGVSVP